MDARYHGIRLFWTSRLNGPRFPLVLMMNDPKIYLLIFLFIIKTYVDYCVYYSN